MLRVHHLILLLLLFLFVFLNLCDRSENALRFIFTSSVILILHKAHVDTSIENQTTFTCFPRSIVYIWFKKVFLLAFRATSKGFLSCHERFIRCTHSRIVTTVLFVKAKFRGICYFCWLETIFNTIVILYDTTLLLILNQSLSIFDSHNYA